MLAIQTKIYHWRHYKAPVTHFPISKPFIKYYTHTRTDLKKKIFTSLHHLQYPQHFCSPLENMKQWFLNIVLSFLALTSLTHCSFYIKSIARFLYTQLISFINSITFTNGFENKIINFQIITNWFKMKLKNQYPFQCDEYIWVSIGTTFMNFKFFIPFFGSVFFLEFPFFKLKYLFQS